VQGTFLEPRRHRAASESSGSLGCPSDRDCYGARHCGKGSGAAAACACASPRAATWRSVKTENQRNRSVCLGDLHQAIEPVIFFLGANSLIGYFINLK